MEESETAPGLVGTTAGVMAMALWYIYRQTKIHASDAVGEEIRRLVGESLASLAVI